MKGVDSKDTLWLLLHTTPSSPQLVPPSTSQGKVLFQHLSNHATSCSWLSLPQTWTEQKIYLVNQSYTLTTSCLLWPWLWLKRLTEYENILDWHMWSVWLIKIWLNRKCLCCSVDCWSLPNGAETASTLHCFGKHTRSMQLIGQQE